MAEIEMIYTTNSSCLEIHLASDGSCALMFPHHKTYKPLYTFSNIELAKDLLATASLHIVPSWLDDRYEWLHVHYNEAGEIKSYFSNLQYYEGFGIGITSMQVKELLKYAEKRG